MQSLSRASNLLRAAPRPFTRPARISRLKRNYADVPPKPPRPEDKKRTGVLFPKTRIAVGVVFCGLLIHSMVILPSRQPHDAMLIDSPGHRRTNQATDSLNC